jgi:tetratricopeptide (TPR) repeat protein
MMERHAMTRTFRKTGPVFMAALTLLAGTALAAASAKNRKADPEMLTREYAACVALVKQHPQEAVEAALFWAGKGGGALAEHCRGLALMALGQFEGAAKSFSGMAKDQKSTLSAATRARLFAQAAQASLSGGKPEAASGFLGQSIKLQPDVATFRIDRSITFAVTGDYEGAVRDLDAVLAADAGNVEALTFRASAYRFLNRLPEAEADISQVLLIQPDRPEALLERGAIRAIGGDFVGARQDWEQIVRIVPDSVAAQAAQDNIQKLSTIRQ